MGWLVLVVVGAALWWWSLALTLRAYRNERIPMWANPAKAPGRAIALRAVAAGAAVFGLGMAAPAWNAPGGVAALIAGALATLLLVAPYVVAVARHNRALRRTA